MEALLSAKQNGIVAISFVWYFNKTKTSDHFLKNWKSNFNPERYFKWCVYITTTNINT